jgi:hypothetical protein
MSLYYSVPRIQEYIHRLRISDDILEYIFRLHVTDEYNEAVYAR